MLEKLAKRNDDWRRLAFQICGNYDLAQDLVQEMYIKLADYKRANDAFVAITIKNLYLDFLKRKIERSVLTAFTLYLITRVILSLATCK